MNNQELIRHTKVKYLDYSLPREWWKLREELDQKHKKFEEIRKKKIISRAGNNKSGKSRQTVKQTKKIKQSTKSPLNQNQSDLKSKSFPKRQIIDEDSQSFTQNILDLLESEEKHTAKHSPKSNQGKRATLKTIQILSNTRKCWPQVSAYLQNVRVSVTYRQLPDISGDMLVIPYKTSALQYYPGNVLKNIYQNKIEKLQSSQCGSVFIVSNKQLPNFRYTAFLKINEKEITQSWEAGFKALIHLIAQNKNKRVNSAIMPVSERTNQLLTILRTIVYDQNTSKVQQLQIYLCYSDLKLFSKAVRQYQQALYL